MSESINRRTVLSAVAAGPVAVAVAAIPAAAFAKQSEEPDALTFYRNFMRATAHLTEHQKGKLADALEAMQS